MNDYKVFLVKVLTIFSIILFYTVIILSIIRKCFVCMVSVSDRNGLTIANPNLWVPSFTIEIIIVLVSAVASLIGVILLVRNIRKEK